MVFYTPAIVFKLLQPEMQQFDECIDTYDDKLTFADMNLSRPLIKALSSMSFVQPTPIQSACIPVALKGRDICACAVTGSGSPTYHSHIIKLQFYYLKFQAPCST